MTHRVDRAALVRGKAGYGYQPCSVGDCPSHAEYDCDDCQRAVCLGHVLSLGGDQHRCTTCTATLRATLPDYRLHCAGCGKLTDGSELGRRIEFRDGVRRHWPGLWCNACALPLGGPDPL